MRNFVLLFAFVAIVLSLGLNSQTLHRSLVGASSGISSETNGRLLQATVGQNIAGEVTFDGSAQEQYVGFWAPTDFIVSVENNVEENPLQLRNYPNPFSAQTTIEFELNFAATASVVIYDMNGQMVNEFRNLSFGAGLAQINWDALNIKGDRVTSGTYLYELTVKPIGGVLSSKKLQVRNILVVSK